SCRSSTGDMATDPGRSWCARRGPSITAGQRRQPGAAPVTWPPARTFLVSSPAPLDALAGNQEHIQPATRDPQLQEQHR
ncbi:hypothetical protein, partial [Aeromonas hydrophila]|uniref:hypothetical protein n=1 Tax=Aeromonas hydrophila TaxID=644 RepID=UPI001C5A9E47